MYLHLGSDVVILKKSIIGIFDLDNATMSYKTREYLSYAEKQGKVINVSQELPKSFVICNENNEYIIYICQLAPNTLIKRAGQL